MSRKLLAIRDSIMQANDTPVSDALIGLIEYVAELERKLEAAEHKRALDLPVRCAVCGGTEDNHHLAKHVFANSASQ